MAIPFPNWHISREFFWKIFDLALSPPLWRFPCLKICIWDDWLNKHDFSVADAIFQDLNKLFSWFHKLQVGISPYSFLDIWLQVSLKTLVYFCFVYLVFSSSWLILLEFFKLEVVLGYHLRNFRLTNSPYHYQDLWFIPTFH